MVSHLDRREAYRLEPRVIAGTREEKLEQIDDEIQHLLKIKSLECGDTDATYLAVRSKSHWFAMTVTILLLLVALVLLLTAATSPATPGSDLVSCTFVLFGRQPRSMHFNSLQVSPNEDKRARNKI